MTRKTFLTLGLLAVFILSACTPSVSAPTATPESGEMPVATHVEEAAPTQEEAPAEEGAMATEEPVEEAMAMPTSRGSQLVATDPETVNLTSGQPQLIEFFAFW